MDDSQSLPNIPVTRSKRCLLSLRDERHEAIIGIAKVGRIQATEVD